MKDPIVEEVRKHRMEHTRRFRGDLTAIYNDLRSIQIASGHNGNVNPKLTPCDNAILTPS